MISWQDLDVFSVRTLDTSTPQQKSTISEERVNVAPPQLSPFVQSIIEEILVFTDLDAKHLRDDMKFLKNRFSRKP